MKRLIVNSDDYGRSSDISRGIREAHLHGIVTSTTCMMNIPTTGEDIAVALRETPNLGLGIHLVLTMGRPIRAPGDVPTLVDEDGKFYRNGPLLERLSSLDIDEVRMEWRAQIECFIEAAGQKPDHIDSHHHSSYFTPQLFRAMLELAQEYGCAIRYPFNEDWRELAETSRQAPSLLQEFASCRPDVIIGSFYDEGATLEHLLHIFNELKDGTSELMCHPGHVDQVFAERESIYNYQRERELEILTAPVVKQAIVSHGIELIPFSSL
jgi:chitin disaccharide deacetylase